MRRSRDCRIGPEVGSELRIATWMQRWGHGEREGERER